MDFQDICRILNGLEWEGENNWYYAVVKPHDGTEGSGVQASLRYCSWGHTYSLSLSSWDPPKGTSQGWYRHNIESFEGKEMSDGHQIALRRLYQNAIRQASNKKCAALSNLLS